MLRKPNYSFLQMRKLSLSLSDFLKVPRQICEKAWKNCSEFIRIIGSLRISLMMTTKPTIFYIWVELHILKNINYHSCKGPAQTYSLSSFPDIAKEGPCEEGDFSGA